MATKIPPGVEVNAGGQTLKISFEIENPNDIALTLDTDESYALKIQQAEDNSVKAVVTSKNFFGARNGLETLGQLCIYDEIRNEMQIAGHVSITDKPVYPYRGILLDTARNYFSIKAIKRTIDGMASSKLNTFHWHITDSHSFPLVTPSRPSLYKTGAYNPYKIYTAKDIEDVIAYAHIRGVRVLPEFDQPAHVGEGWQDFNVTACFKFQPWGKYCVEPPCGQLDPTKDKVYDILQDIFNDMFKVFKPDIFHMGGDEVSNTCWNSSTNIQDWMLAQGWGLQNDDFMRLWGNFQNRSLANVIRANGGKKIPIIMWTSTLTELPHVTTYLPNDTYIIQVWTTGTDKQIVDLLSNGYKLIMSNYDATYLDCGFGSWVGEGNNWCSPYIGWQKVYMNSPRMIAGQYHDQVLGGEVTLWSEQSDDTTVDSRLWPRAAALSERLWGEPVTGWQEAQYRMLVHRERLVEQGIAADSIQPQWCTQNEGYCPWVN